MASAPCRQCGAAACLAACETLRVWWGAAAAAVAWAAACGTAHAYCAESCAAHELACLGVHVVGRRCRQGARDAGTCIAAQWMFLGCRVKIFIIMGQVISSVLFTLVVLMIRSDYTAAMV